MGELNKHAGQRCEQPRNAGRMQLKWHWENARAGRGHEMELFNFLTLRLLSGWSSAEHMWGQNKRTSSSFLFFFFTPLTHANDITLFMDVPARCMLSAAFCSATCAWSYLQVKQGVFRANRRPNEKRNLSSLTATNRYEYSQDWFQCQRCCLVRLRTGLTNGLRVQKTSANLMLSDNKCGSWSTYQMRTITRLGPSSTFALINMPEWTKYWEQWMQIFANVAFHCEQSLTLAPVVFFSILFFFCIFI